MLSTFWILHLFLELPTNLDILGIFLFFLQLHPSRDPGDLLISLHPPTTREEICAFYSRVGTLHDRATGLLIQAGGDR